MTITTARPPVPVRTQEPEPADASLPAVAVIGTGTMGAAMARNLLRAGFRVHVWNRTPARTMTLAADGALAHAEPALAAADASVVITMLPDAAALTSVVLRCGLLTALAPGAIWLQMGTIGVTATEELVAVVRDRRPDVRFVDAPVSGTRGPAESGELLILASGPGEARPALAPVLAAVGRQALWLGPAGAGSRLKLVLNTWLAFLAEGIAETAALADVLGVRHEALSNALAGGPLDAGFAAAKLAKIDSGDETPDFSLRWALKDVDLAVDAGGGWRLPVTAAISGLWHELVRSGLGGKDVSAVRAGLG